MMDKKQKKGKREEIPMKMGDKKKKEMDKMMVKKGKKKGC